MKTVAELEDYLSGKAENLGIDWYIKLDVCHESCWSIEVRVTLDPNCSGPDVSTVFYSVAGSDPDECAYNVAPAIAEFLAKNKSGA